MLAPTGTLSGLVTDEESGNGLERVCVVAESATGDATRHATTGAEGAYRVDDLPAGDYVVLFEDCSDPLTHVSARSADAVSVRSGEGHPRRRRSLTEGGVLSGRVTSVHNGQEQQLVCVALHRAEAADGSPPVARDVTGVVRDAESFTSFGAFVLEGVPPGTYDLAYKLSGDCGSDAFATLWHDDAPTRDTAQQVVVDAGDTIGGLDAVLRARRYAPEQTVTRGQMATFLVNGYEAATDLALRAPQDRFADDDGTTHEQSIDKAATAGFTAGTPEGTYAPSAPVRRDQMASFLARLLDRVQRDTTHGDP